MTQLGSWAGDRSEDRCGVTCGGGYRAITLRNAASHPG